MKTKKVKRPMYFLRNADESFPFGIPKHQLPYLKHINGKPYTTLISSTRYYEGTEIGGIYG